MARQDKVQKVAWYRSVQTKVLVTLLVVTTLILAGFAVYNLAQARERLSGELERLAETTVQRLSQHLIGPLWALDREQLAESIEAAMLERRVHAIIIRGEDRESVFMGRRRDGEWDVVQATSEPQGDFILSKTTLLHDNEEMIGVLEVYVSRRFLNDRFNELVRTEIRRAAVLDVALILVTLLLLGRVLVRPIRRLTDAAERIAGGQLSTDIDVRSRDEIGMLAGAVNKLQTSLRIAMERIKQRG
ncbi:MAG: HAMP domain-containing protein [Halofilum sp. (in: g-proteobacteria)]|nr:HAMP domain-containing protein [Halofilum sp. (in: g-proteobacteria)]